ncbi:MAG: zf-HC2 domain-containing protein [Gemmatimonadota bacterium]|jgi:hypothetical protein
MSHVDNGLIHAWLDGALMPGDPKRTAFEEHLELCDECRARVEAERRIRDRAADVLKSVAPDAVRVEPFEQMIARRRAERAAAEAVPAAPDDVPGRVDTAPPATAAPSRRRRRFVPLAWAASLLMAVSAGWFARTWLPSRYVPADQVAERPVVETDLAPTAAAPARDAVAEPQAIPPATAAPPTSAAGSVVSETRGDAAGAGAATGLRNAAVGAVGAQEEKVAAKVEAEARAADTAAGVTSRPLNETRRLANAMMADDTARSNAVRLQPSAPALSAREAGGGADPVLEAYRSARWETVTEAVATERLGRTPLRIEGLPVDSLTAAPSGGRWLVRVVQSIGPDGATAEILQWPTPLALDQVVVAGQAAGDTTVDAVRQRVEAAQRADAGRRAELLAAITEKPGPVPAERPAVRVDVLGFSVVLRADVSADSLKVLATRVR